MVETSKAASRNIKGMTRFNNAQVFESHEEYEKRVEKAWTGDKEAFDAMSITDQQNMSHQLFEIRLTK